MRFVSEQFKADKIFFSLMGPGLSNHLLWGGNFSNIV